MVGSARAGRRLGGRVITSDFRPAYGLGNPHLQTIWPTLIGRADRLGPRFEQLELPDGDFLDLAWNGAQRPRCLLLVLHGLEGSWRSPYARSLLALGPTRGWTVVVVHFRGCSGRPNRLDRGYHSGDTGDLRFVVDTLGRRHPDVPICAIGYSLGGNVLLKCLGEPGPSCPLRAAVAVSVPLVLAESAARLERGASRFYQWWFLRDLKRKLAAKFAGRSDPPVIMERVRRARSMREFDHQATAPLHGFASADHYYRESSARGFLAGIDVPALIIAARDDPLMTPAVLPAAEELPAGVTLELADRGGHVGFVAATEQGGRHWVAGRALDFLEDALAGQAATARRPPPSC